MPHCRAMHEPATRQLHLNRFIHGRGRHEAAWRHPTASPLPLTDIRSYTDLAQKRAASAETFITTRLARRPATMAAVAR